MRSPVVVVALAALAACSGARPRAPIPPDLREAPGPEGFNTRAFVDEAASEVVVWAGPFRVAPTAGGHAHGPAGSADERHDGVEHDGARSPVIPIAWPADGYIRGFSLELRDGAGNPLPRALMHHLIAVNFDRRMFAYPVAERLFGIGTETGDQELPKTVGVPLEAGQNLGFYVMWDNATGEAVEDVYVRLAMPWTPAGEAGDIVEVMPLYVDVNSGIGTTNAYDLEPGRSVRSWEFEPPVSGRILIASGHLHDFGRVVRLEDAETDEVLLEIESELDAEGLIEDIDIEVLGVWYGGLRLERGHPYRIVGVYDSPLSETVPMGAMAHIVGIFAPDRPESWPAADPTSEIWALDLSGLPRQTAVMTQGREALRREGGTP